MSYKDLIELIQSKDEIQDRTGISNDYMIVMEDMTKEQLFCEISRAYVYNNMLSAENKRLKKRIRELT